MNTVSPAHNDQSPAEAPQQQQSRKKVRNPIAIVAAVVFVVGLAAILVFKFFFMTSPSGVVILTVEPDAQGGLNYNKVQATLYDAPRDDTFILGFKSPDGRITIHDFAPLTSGQERLFADPDFYDVLPENGPVNITARTPVLLEGPANTINQMANASVTKDTYSEEELPHGVESVKTEFYVAILK